MAEVWEGWRVVVASSHWAAGVVPGCGSVQAGRERHGARVQGMMATFDAVLPVNSSRSFKRFEERDLVCTKHK